jgi:membrane-bound ClpP family serine protease
VDLPLAIALLAAYIRNPPAEDSLFVVQVDLNGAIGQADPVYVRSPMQSINKEGQLG